MKLDGTTGNFYPRSPCGERQVNALELADAMLFLSTLSLRRATVTEIWDVIAAITISIHALLAESDAKQAAYFFWQAFLSTLSLRRATYKKRTKALHAAYFYPRSPCGERLFDAVQVVIVKIFLSTLSLRRATGVAIVVTSCVNISIHALLAESDLG